MFLFEGNFVMKIVGISCRYLCLLILLCLVVGAYASVSINKVEENDTRNVQRPFVVGYTSTVYEPFSCKTPLQYNALYGISSEEQWIFPVDPAEPGMPPTAIVDDFPIEWLLLCVLLYVCVKYKHF